MWLSFILVFFCIFDWLYAIPQWLIRCQWTQKFTYFYHLANLWQSNRILSSFIFFICLFGLFKSIKTLKKTISSLIKFIKSLFKKTILINVPILIYLLIIYIKFNQYLPYHRNISFRFFDIKYVHGIYEEIHQNFYSSLLTILLFSIGSFHLLTNNLIRTSIGEVFRIIKQIWTIIQLFISFKVRTPLSLLNLVILNVLINALPNISVFIKTNFTFWSLFYLGLIAILVYGVFRWFWSTPKLKVVMNGDIIMNDISGLNRTRVYSVFYPRTINDIQYLIYKARLDRRTISVRGQGHTMGGQTLPSRKSTNKNYVCDLKYMNRIEYDENNQQAVVEAGATWTDVIKTLNLYGRSPVIMQSYCTFSVAGTISVNAHGITSDDAMYESVLSIKYLDSNGNEGECSREDQPELFSLMIGGYGLFGIITHVRMKTVSNVKTDLEYVRLQSDQFDAFYEKFLNDPTVEIKIGRVDLSRPQNILMFIFRKHHGTEGTIADLEPAARSMKTGSHLIYTYLVQNHLFRRLRFALEKAIARPLDLTHSSDRNTTMYESAKPMALLYQPLKFYDDTFILQEYFVPKRFFLPWYNRVRTILGKRYSNLFLLNLTIRFVKKDQCTYLAYTKREDCYAFVFYFRIKRNEQGDGEVRQVHQKLIELTFEYQGTFYLPYRQHYSYKQIQQAYPMIDEFFMKKLAYDRNELFSNDWYEHYRPKSTHSIVETEISPVELVTDRFVKVIDRRSDSFKRVIENEQLRERFRLFLQTVFDAEPIHVMFHYVNRAVQNPHNQNDNDIYKDLQNVLKVRQYATTRRIFSMIKQIRQLRVQILDMIRQQITIFNQLGCAGKINDIVSIGDGGRCIQELKKILKIKNGNVYLINDRQRLTDIIERNSIFPLGKFIPYDFSNLTDVPIPSQSVDLVVCYMGLHHLPQTQLHQFLTMVFRILRPNGLFLFREHHATEDLKPLLDVAHMVFNVVTDVSYQSEINEIRAFRTIEQWRSLLRLAGFEDTFVYNEQEDDPTDDIMMVFRKPAEYTTKTNNISEIVKRENFHRISSYSESNYFRPCEWLIVRIAIEFGQSLNHTPFYLFPYIKYLSIFWSLLFTETNLAINKFGWQTALTNTTGFMMNIVVGICLSIGFLQLSFVSLLIRICGGARQEPEYEQLIIENTSTSADLFDFKTLIDESIDMIEQSADHRLYSIRVFRHRTFTNVLKKLAAQGPHFILRSVSDQTDALQIELKLHKTDRECLLWVKQREHLEFIFEFVDPMNKNDIHLFVRVDIPHLLEFIRICQPWQENGTLEIIQIYDHFE